MFVSKNCDDSCASSLSEENEETNKIGTDWQEEHHENDQQPSRSAKRAKLWRQKQKQGLSEIESQLSVLEEEHDELQRNNRKLKRKLREELADNVLGHVSGKGTVQFDRQFLEEANRLLNKGKNVELQGNEKDDAVDAASTAAAKELVVPQGLDVRGSYPLSTLTRESRPRNSANRNPFPSLSLAGVSEHSPMSFGAGFLPNESTVPQWHGLLDSRIAASAFLSNTTNLGPGINHTLFSEASLSSIGRPTLLLHEQALQDTIRNQNGNLSSARMAAATTMLQDVAKTRQMQGLNRARDALYAIDNSSGSSFLDWPRPNIGNAVMPVEMLAQQATETESKNKELWACLLRERGDTREALHAIYNRQEQVTRNVLAAHQFQIPVLEQDLSRNFHPYAGLDLLPTAPGSRPRPMNAQQSQMAAARQRQMMLNMLQQHRRGGQDVRHTAETSLFENEPKIQSCFDNDRKPSPK
jgi:hypothetical protein